MLRENTQLSNSVERFMQLHYIRKIPLVGKTYSKIIFPPTFNGIFASRMGKNSEWKKQMRLKSEMQNCWRYVLVESFNIKLDISILIFRFR